LRTPALAFAALACQAIGIAAISPDLSDGLHRGLIDAGYVLALIFVARNWRVPAVRVLAAGLALNLAPMLTNGGLMPVTPSNALRAGFGDEVAALQLGDAVPHSKDVLMLRRDTTFAPLSDTIVLPRRVPGRGVFSPGDVVIAAALLLAAAGALTGGIRRTTASRRHSRPAIHAQTAEGP
jgi:hypothetical protein